MPGPKRPSSKPTPPHSEHVQLELESVLRIRPLLKKEREDQVVLEPRRKQDGKISSAVLHPMLGRQKHHPESPAMKMISPETLHLCKDTEYHVDYILPDDADQEKVYYGIGLPIARESMEFLKFKKSATGVYGKTNLIVCMGVENSGKTHTCFGGSIPKRRSSQDGLVPRILDSLFSQSKHHVKDTRNLSFGVRMSLLQVTQTRTEQPKHTDDSQVFDLLLPSLSKAAASPLRSPSPTRLPSVKSLVATLERARGSVTSSSTRSQSESLVSISQDPDSMDFTTNALFKTCRDVTEARQMLSSGLHAGQKLTSRTNVGHILAILQPVLLGPDGSTEREGSRIAVLDMAGIEQSAQKKRNAAVRRHKDSVGNAGQSDIALNAVLHCVRSLHHNSMILSGKTPALDIVDDTYNGITIDDNTSEISCVSEVKSGKAKGPTFKVVPYRQHNLTMLLQPLFSVQQTTTTKLTLLMAAYPGHRDHAEKKSLLNDLELLMTASRERKEGKAVTGLEKQPLSPIMQFSLSSEEGDDQSTEVNQDRCQLPSKKKKFDDLPLPSAPTMDTVPSPSLAYSMDEDDALMPLPPPFAPNSAPFAAATEPVAVNPTAPSAPMVVDFPGVVMPQLTNENQPLLEEERALEPHPLEAERPFEKDPPPPRNSHSSAVKQRVASSVQPLQATTVHNVMKNESPAKSSTSPTKTWLTGLSGSTTKALNHVVHASAKKGQKMIDKMRATPDKPAALHSHTASTPIHSNSKNITKSSTFSKQRGPEVQQAERIVLKPVTASIKSPLRQTKKSDRREMKKLEDQNHELSKRNHELETKCRSLIEENAELKRALGNARKPNWSNEDEENWNNHKKSLAAAPLIQSPLSKHMHEVKRTFETSGRYNFALSQDQFRLQYPSYFKRASELESHEQESSLLTSPKTPGNRAGGGSSEKRKSTSTNLNMLQRSLERVKRRKSSLLPAVRER
jgi:hypothetical protein